MRRRVEAVRYDCVPPETELGSAHRRPLSFVVTPGFKDIIFHLQFCTSLAMIAVQWPDVRIGPLFLYPGRA